MQPLAKASTVSAMPPYSEDSGITLRLSPPPYTGAHVEVLMQSRECAA